MLAVKIPCVTESVAPDFPDVHDDGAIHRRGLTAAQGTALYVGAVLGTGVIALPALAAGVAGPASLLAWVLMIAASAPLAATFAALGSRHPDAGGVSTYTRLAFGDRAAGVVGWCFYFGILPGAPAAALFGGAYVEAAFGGGPRVTALAGLGLLVAAIGSNIAGIRIAGRVQLVVAGVLVAFLLLAVVLSLPSADLSNMTPFAPHGFAAIGPAAALLVWSFVGWEAITHLTGEFRRPDRDVPRATTFAVVIVGVIYLAVAVAVILVLGGSAADTAAPLGELFAAGLGPDARLLAAAVAVFLTFGVMNAYLAGAAKLGAALARDGALPPWLSRGSSAGEVPRRSLALIGILTLAVLVAAIALDLDLEPLVLLTTGAFVTVYAVGVAAALRLLPRSDKAWWAAAVSLMIVLFLLVMTGPYLAWAAVVCVGAVGYLTRSRLRTTPTR